MSDDGNVRSEVGGKTLSDEVLDMRDEVIGDLDRAKMAAEAEDVISNGGCRRE